MPKKLKRLMKVEFHADAYRLLLARKCDLAAVETRDGADVYCHVITADADLITAFARDERLFQRVEHQQGFEMFLVQCRIMYLLVEMSASLEFTSHGQNDLDIFDVTPFPEPEPDEDDHRAPSFLNLPYFLKA